MSTGLTDLPLEIRQQIFGDYFRVSGGYVYDGKSDKLRNADNTPIDLSLIYTCRSIANDCKTLPLAVNTLHFSTLYREDWRSLAGCFNLAATYYKVLQQDLLLHLAPLITPKMHAELATEFPGFQAKLEAEREFHFHTWRTGDDAGFVSTGNNVRPAPCQYVRDFFESEIADIGEKSPLEYHGYYHVDLEYLNSPTGVHLELVDSAYQRWNYASPEIDQCLTRCLRLIADQNPTEFGTRLLTSLPHWVDKYGVEEFFNLRFDNWAIPGRSQVEYALNLLGIPEFVWKLPDMWSYDREFYYELGDNPSPGQFSEQHDHPTLEFLFRSREKIRFSAVAVAVRFLGLLPPHQRTQIRTLDLHEDLPSVNRSSLHGYGLIPLLNENPLLRVQRRVNVINCLTYNYFDAEDLSYLSEPGETGSIFVGDIEFTNELSCWLLASLEVANAGISAEWFTLFLESGPYADHCAEAFDELVHARIATHHAWNQCLESGLLKDLSSTQVKELSRRYYLEKGFEDAIMHLVHQTSSVLRCNFNTGLPRDHQRLVDGMKANEDGVWDYWRHYRYGKNHISLPGHLQNREALAPFADIQSQEEYLQSQR